MVRYTQNLQVGLRVWSGGEIFSKQIDKKWRAHNAPPPPIITKVKGKGKQLSKQNSEIRVGLLKTELYA